MRAVVVISNLGPFHAKRVRAANCYFERAGDNLVCVQVAGRQDEYPWGGQSRDDKERQCLTLFDGHDYDEVTYLAVRQPLFDALQNICPDVVVVPGWGLKESWPALGYCLRRGVPRVLVSDSREIDRTRRIFRETVKASIVSTFQAGFAAGTPHLGYLTKLGLPAAWCTTGCDVVDNDFFASESVRQRGQRIHDVDSMRLLSCVRLVDVKNIPRALEALAGVDLPWSWGIAGRGPERARIERTIERLGLGDRVHLLGPIPYSQLPAVHAEHDCYLQPSYSEPWGLAVNEAMASGLPVLVSRQCGCSIDLVREGVNGFTFEALDVRSIAGAVKGMWESRERWVEMGKASQAIIKPWSLDLYARNLHRACTLAIERARLEKGKLNPWELALRWL